MFRIIFEDLQTLLEGIGDSWDPKFWRTYNKSLYWEGRVPCVCRSCNGVWDVTTFSDHGLRCRLCAPFLNKIRPHFRRIGHTLDVKKKKVWELYKSPLRGTLSTWKHIWVGWRLLYSCVQASQGSATMVLWSSQDPQKLELWSKKQFWNFQKPKIKLKKDPLKFQNIKNIYKEEIMIQNTILKFSKTKNQIQKRPPEVLKNKKKQYKEA